MLFLVFLMVKWSIKLWLFWALLSLMVAFCASVAGHERAAREWTLSLNWRRVFQGSL